jgi:hypothetical protein
MSGQLQTMAPVGVHTPQRVPGGDLLMAMSAESVHARVQAIQQVMKAVMKKGTHYDVIPGTEKKDAAGNDISKPVLLKPGAEVLCMTFGIAPRLKTTVTGDHPTVAYHWKDRKKEWFNKPNGGRDFVWKDEEGDTFGYFEVVTVCEILGPDGRLLASAEGSANNREKRYRNINVYEQRNTIIKMSGKRALMAAVLLATGASDMFTQDLDDTMDDDRGQGGTQGQGNRPASTGGSSQQSSGAQPTGWMSEPQKKLVWAKAKKAGVDEEVTKHVIEGLNVLDKKKAKPYLDAIADEKPEAQQIWDKAKESLAAEKKKASEEPPLPDEPTGAPAGNNSNDEIPL